MKQLQSEIAAALPRIPTCLQAEVQRALAALPADGVDYSRAAASSAWPKFVTAAANVWAMSEWVAASCVQYPELWNELLASGDLIRSYPRGALAVRLLREAQTELGEATLEQLKCWLRLRRRREMARIAWRDLAGDADLAETIATLSEFADACVQIALAAVATIHSNRYGAPRGEQSGQPQGLVVLAMGKLGGEELNFSSDIDLIFAYPEDGETVGARAQTNEEFFARVARDLIAVLSEATAEGMVFRVDMRLRPNGSSGPLALSFDAMEHYYQAHGREWERYAWIKARVCAGDAAAGAALLARLKPFVYRKYFDYGALAAIRELKENIDRETARKSANQNIKTGVGGIREIEFIGQAFQLIHGGREPRLQVRAIQDVLPQLAARGQLTATAVTELLEAYRFLRNTEHRLQMVRDQQTHVLPADDCERARLAFAMGYAHWAAFTRALEQHLTRVHGHFERIFVAPQGEESGGDRALVALWKNSLDDHAQLDAWRSNGFTRADDVKAATDLLAGLRRGGAYTAFSAQGRERIDKLMPLLIAAAGLTAEPATTLARLVKLIEAIGRRSAYFALLIENPMALSQLVKLCAASAWIADWLSSHPILLDELLNPANLYAPRSRAQLESEIAQRLSTLAPDDLEAQMEALREFRHGQVLRIAAAEIGVGLMPLQARHHLSEVAEVIVEQTLELAQRALASRHGRPATARETAGFAVIAYGKLGSHELGYGSDLDLIFLHEGSDEGMTAGARAIPNALFFARLGQRIIHLLTTRTAAGILYQVDMRLRPSGQAGPLVTTTAAFADYQHTKAWPWEHQALVRARAVGGDAAVRARFAAIRHAVLTQPRDEAALREAVLEMRARMRAAQPDVAADRFDLKHDRGGIVDIEFMVQYWVLRWAATHPQLTAATENIRILEALSAAGVIDGKQMQALVAAYTLYLSIEQRLKLMEHRAQVMRSEVGDAPMRVAEIWQQVFNEG